MPFIIMKRSDIPAGTLQVLDLQPNESQRNLIYDPPAQSKYLTPVKNDAVATTTVGGVIRIPFKTQGLAAWLITNVNDGTGAAAAGDVTVGAGNAADGDTVAIDTTSIGGPSITYTFRVAPALANEIEIGGTPTDSAVNLAAAITADFVGFLTAANALGVVDIDVVPEGTAGNAVTFTVVGAELARTNPVGGVDADALTAAEANTSAADILDLLKLGNLAAPAAPLTLAAVNGEMAAGALTAAQLPSLLGVLAGRDYTVPANTVIEAASAFGVSPAISQPGGPSYGPNRPTYDTSSLTLSVTTGHLAGFLAHDFEYQYVSGTNGEAVAVYNDDGTLFV